ncbi:HalOD1 output domain-containing protein [Natrinema sp. LN54]|uniref:HalOD1 output domain-containing protein n=1 Tax=Natrinema sp. LN54 TaxID=3458705 RepID=UPI00403502D1
MNPERGSNAVVADGGTAFLTERDPEESTTEAISRSIAAVKGVPETDLDPLYSKIELEALETMVRHADERGRSVQVEFTVDEYTVLVRGDGEIRIRPDDAGGYR